MSRATKEADLAYQREYTANHRSEYAAWCRSPKGRYSQHKKEARKRGVEFLFSFDDWWQVWEASGKWEQRGRQRDQYVMCRNGDVGPYSKDNVYIATQAENMKDRWATLSSQKHARAAGRGDKTEEGTT